MNITRFHALKIHGITDSPGNPLDFILTSDQAGDIGQAKNLLTLTTEGAAALLADKDYDSNAFVQTLTEKRLEPVIPPRAIELIQEAVIGSCIRNVF